MTDGQTRALRELKRLYSVQDSALESYELIQPKDSSVIFFSISVRIGLIDKKEGGLGFREVEDFLIRIPPDFPFAKPSAHVLHRRFTGFPHVVWGAYICLYQSEIEWNPSDGLYGFFERFDLWIRQAAKNEMDPLAGPLEPPHHITDFDHVAFVIRENIPCQSGEEWLGLAKLEKHKNRIELTEWCEISDEWPKDGQMAFAVVLPKPMPMEFPSKGKQLFAEMENAGMSRDALIRNLSLAAILTPEDEPIYFVLGLPMRRGLDGSEQLHLAVWSIEAEKAKSFKQILPKKEDTPKILQLRDDLCNSLMSLLEVTSIKWCQVLEDRSEITVRRDHESALAWFMNKNVLVVGCGALGSWVAEMVVRSGAKAITVVDNSKVKPGILVRQNFVLEDIGAEKAVALSRHLTDSVQNLTVTPHYGEAHNFILSDPARFSEYDMMIDCTASLTFQMKLERDWNKLNNKTPPCLSMIIDSMASNFLCVVTQANSSGGIWDAFVSLKQLICFEGNNFKLVESFYSPRAADKLFQPEPGCSDPTFVGSMADVVSLGALALKSGLSRMAGTSANVGVICATSESTKPGKEQSNYELPPYTEVQVGSYRVRLSKKIFTQAKAWVQNNNRIRPDNFETGGLLWGVWDDAVQVIWITDVSGPPRDSEHEPAHFTCGTEGTVEEHDRRIAVSRGSCGFVGYWHTHPKLSSHQSREDHASMAGLVSKFGSNSKRSIMLIFGRAYNIPTAGLYVYESQDATEDQDEITIGETQIFLKETVV